MENLIPAVTQSNEKSLKDLSPLEFQQLLSSWLQEKGIIQDMKSYLKFQMINALKNTVIGKNMGKCVSQTYSLANQAIHLIVAEYLLQNQCHFTLSLFSNEVNLTNILPQHQRLFYNGSIARKATNIFDKENLINILELLGVSKDNEHFTKIYDQYFDDGMSPLLSCLIDAVGKSAEQQSNVEQECKTDINLEDDFMKNIYQMIDPLNLPQKTQTKLLHNIKLCYDLKTKSFEKQCIKLVSKFKKELSGKNKRFTDGEKQRKLLEKKILKLQQENESLREKIELLLNEHKVIQNEQTVPPQCYLKHCNEKCNEATTLHEMYGKEIEVLRIENKNQQKDIQRLSFNCNELLKEFSCCQSKINLVNTRIKEKTSEDVNLLTARTDKDIENVSVDSDATLAEEIVHQARQKLKLLEEESKELDIRFSKFVIK